MKLKITYFFVCLIFLLPIYSFSQSVVPTACASQTFNITSNQNFYDDGGLGGLLCSDGAANNFCNCNCETTTTICVPSGQFLRVDFSVFAMFNTSSAFDWMKIYDGQDIMEPVMFNNDVGGADHFPHGGSGSGYGDCGDDIPPVGFCSSGRCLTFEFHASGVVNRAGWEAALQIVNAGCVLLPLQLLHFEAKAAQHHVDIEWTVSSEQINDLYHVERSTDGIDWEIVNTVETNQKQASVVEHHYRDMSPLEGLSYYRLRQIDHSGTLSFSTVEAVERATKSNTLTVFPNPSQGQIQIGAHKLGTIRIQNTMGQDCTSSVTIDYINQQKARIDLRRLSAGIYILRSSSGSRTIQLKY